MSSSSASASSSSATGKTAPAVPNKYANLPDLDVASPDVYETPDTVLPSSSSAQEPITPSYSSDEDDDFESDQRFAAYTEADRLRLKLQRQDLVKDKVSMNESVRKFRNKEMDANHVDFSGKIPSSKKRFKNRGYRTLPEPVDTFYTLDSESGEQQQEQGANADATVQQRPKPPQPPVVEDPLTRLRRLMHEVHELRSQVDKPEKAAELGVPASISHKKLMQTIEKLEGDLEGLSVSVPAAAEAIGADGDHELKKNATSVHTLVNQLQSFQSQQPQQSGKSDSTNTPAEHIVYDLYHPIVSQSTSSHATTTAPLTTWLPALEKRIDHLEKTIGTSFNSLATLNHSDAEPMVKQISKLESLLDVLSSLSQSPSSMTITSTTTTTTTTTATLHDQTASESFTRKLKSLTNELETLIETRKKLLLDHSITESDQNPQHHQQSSQQTTDKIDHLYKTLTTHEPIFDLIPHLIARCTVLKPLHITSLSFHSSLSDLQEKILQLDTKFQRVLQADLVRLEESFVENKSLVEKNVAVVQSRVEDLVKRLDALKQ